MPPPLHPCFSLDQLTPACSALLLYLGAMHLLVFFTIYHSAHNVHHGCDPAMDHVLAHAHHAAP